MVHLKINNILGLMEYNIVGGGTVTDLPSQEVVL